MAQRVRVGAKSTWVRAMSARGLPRRTLSRPELVGTVLDAVRRAVSGRDIVDVMIEGEGEDWGVTAIRVAAPERLPEASWALAVIEPALHDLYALAPDRS